MNATTEYSILEDIMAGGYVWVWETPDGAAMLGTADTEEQANAAAQQAISDWYFAAH